MTDAERQMMDTIHTYGLIFSMDADTKKFAIDCIEAILKGEQHEQ